ncbi:MAG: protein phosphatase CheZ [Sneathiella sp.]|nr:protein phosphatase CheZ [Sneathiella sp.]
MTQKKIYSAEISRLKQGNVSADTAEPSASGINQEQYDELLNAINSVKDDIANGFSENSEVSSVNEAVLQDFKKEYAESLQLKQELEALSHVIMDTRREIASLTSQGDGQKIHGMTDQLDAVVGDTETATNSILAAVETIEDKNESLELNATSPEELEIVEGITNSVMKIYEACSFQDITGQRISKVVGTLKFVEDRIASMIDILGGDKEFDDIEKVEHDAQMDGDVELSGPQAEDQKISQDEIDALFD